MIPRISSQRRRKVTALLAAVATTALCAVPAVADAVIVTPRPVTTPRWVTGATVTEYYPAPERWFRGRKVRIPGLAGVHRIDWAFSARGVTMEGDGIGLNGLPYHVENVGRGGWVDSLGRASYIGAPIFWRAGAYYRNSRNQLTYPLDPAGWSNGVGVRYVPLYGSLFRYGRSLPLTYYHSLAVDPRIIPLGSRVYLPAYHALGGGCFLAQDTGGAIGGYHVDVYRPPPATAAIGGRYLTSQRMYVIPRGKVAPAGAPCGTGVAPTTTPTTQTQTTTTSGASGGSTAS